MPLSKPIRIKVASTDDLLEGTYRRINLLYTGKESSVLVFRLKGEIHGFLNQCVHMPRELDSEEGNVIDPSGSYVRCTMHGINYDPCTGESVSTMCNGERLQRVKVVEDDRIVWIQDKRAKPLGQLR